MGKTDGLEVYAFTKFPVTIYWMHKGGRVQLVQKMLYPGKLKKDKKK